MKTCFRCRDPFDTVARVMDTARRLGLAADALWFERTDPEQFSVTLSIPDADPWLAATFVNRIALLPDLDQGFHDA
ncbi:MAG: hypothetical protein H6898_16550 [Rhodobacter sp.]|nr:hypothetical protein [Paracoccaceae bacterium]MCC0078167.1 hypothetical protein [Rhodobacter sp.]